MTTKQIENITKTYTTVYVAADGKEFDDEEACSTYDKSFACAMKSYLRDMSIRETSTEEDLFYTGSCENEVFIVVPKTQKDILHIKQFAIGLGTSEERVDKWIDDGDIDTVILVTVGYNNDWVYISRLNTIIKNIVGENYKLVPAIDYKLAPVMN